MKDVYLKFTKKANSRDIPGESRDSEHKGWIEVGSWHQSMHQPASATASTAGGHTAERVEHSVMSFTKDIDKSSVYLCEACSAAYAYDAEVEFFRSNGTVRTKYLTIKMTNAIIASVDMSVPESGLPTETIGIKYAKIVWNYKGSDTDGSANVGNEIGGWDLALNKTAA